MIRPNRFRDRRGCAVTLTDDARHTVLAAWTERKKEELRHPFLDEAVTLGLVPHIQAQLLARHLREDLERGSKPRLVAVFEMQLVSPPVRGRGSKHSHGTGMRGYIADWCAETFAGIG